MRGPSVERYREQITLAEASLISYFKPTYNVQHKNSFPGKRSSLALSLDAQGYTNLFIALSDGGSGVQFWSPTRHANRHHRFSSFLPSVTQLQHGYLAIAAEEVEESLISVDETVATAIENSPITLALLPGSLPERFNRI